jgi:hypothetical protein
MSTAEPKLIRVFPSRTKATPDDDLARFGPPDLFDRADEVHVSVTFTCDRPAAERLAAQWERVAPVKIGGPAYGLPAHDDPFVPGRYVKEGYTFTSRGCPRSCWFCAVHRVYGRQIHELPIIDGFNVLDDNLLACSRPHVEAVFRMLQRVSREKRRRVEFTGGLEALSLEDYQVGLLAGLSPRPNCFFAYDPQDAFETLESAARRLLAAGFTARSHRLRCYCLIGYPKDKFAAAEARLRDLQRIGFTPFAMLWRPMTASEERWAPSPDWRGIQRKWARPAIIHSRASA